MVRFKNRYFVFEISPTDGSSPFAPLDIAEKDLFFAVIQATEQIHGEFGAAALRNGMNVKYCNQLTRIGMIRTRHGPHRLLGSSLPFVSKIGKKPVRLDNVYTGATMVKCFLFLKKYQREKLEEMLKKCKNNVERQNILKNIAAVSSGKLQRDNND
nr:EOG090X0GYO [Sida crystallina]